MVTGRLYLQTSPSLASQGMELFKNQIHHNCRIKTYPDGTTEILVCNRQLFREPGWEAEQRERPRQSVGCGTDDADNLDRAMRRARSAVRDIAMSNDWSWFVTLTLDARQVDRYDITAITRKLNNWLDNHVRRHGLVYVLVPERHKDGAVHFHGFFNGALRAVDSRHKDGHGHKVYNLPQWTLGYTTAIALYGKKQSAVGYVCKYVSKQAEKIGGGGITPAAR